MATANIRAVITAEDRASAVVSGFGDKVQKSAIGIAAAAAGAGLALERLTTFLGGTLDAANRNQAALTGLSSVAKAFNTDVNAATQAAKDLATDGLMSVTEAATGLKNLLASGFSLDQAVQLMRRFKDSAAFGRQAALTFGQAVTSATEGIKNGNSILVDNAGVTKNLSVILEEAGFSAQDLMKATQDASIRQALFNGIIKETNPQLGDAARLTELFAGKQAQVSAQTTILKERIGTALQPIMLRLLEVITPLVEKVSAWVQEHPRLTATIILGTLAFLTLVAVLGAVAAAVGAVIAGVISLKALLVIGIVGAIGAAAAAVALNIDKIRAWFAALPGWIQSALATVPGIIVRAFLGPLGSVLDVLNKVGEKFRNIPGANVLRSIGNLPGFAEGGVVPGPIGAPTLAVVHGGETVVPANGKAPAGVGGTVNLSVNVGTFVGTEMEKRKLAEELFRAYEELQSARGRSWSQASRAA